jgi:putative protease
MGLVDFFQTIIGPPKKKAKRPGKATARKPKAGAGKKSPKKRVVKKALKSKAKRKSPPKKKVLKPRKSSGRKRPSPEVKEKEIGIITHYFGKISVGIIKLKGPLAVGEKIHIKGAHDDFTQAVSSMQLNHKDISRAKKGDEVGIKVTQRVHENDRVYRRE